MSDIRSVILELVRPGPSHNQLLSPLTPYVALCGGDSPVTVNLPFEHRQLLLRLSRLRYELVAGEETQAQKAQRQGELRDMGEILGQLLGRIPALLGELNRIRSDGGKLMHLNLSLSAAELGMVPFESAIAPAGFPGSGSPLFLQTHTPICITREIRRGQPLSLNWNRKPKVLFAYAQPSGTVPFRDHLKELYSALEPWIHKRLDHQDQAAEIGKSLKVLANASLQEIRDLCAEESFTHVHILAHGIPGEQADENRFGLALCRHDDKSQLDNVSGTSLAYALLGRSCPGGEVEAPHLVSLATCDSGNQGSVLVPGGSIAHELHAAGIPWVIASQFPLWKSASTILVRELFGCMLEGEDPRWVLYGARQRLRTDCPEHHDWASVVAYAAVPADFDRQVIEFRNAQTRGRMNINLDRLDHFARTVRTLADSGNGESDLLTKLQEISVECEKISAELSESLIKWCGEVRADAGAGQLRNPELAERLGLLGACSKRSAIVWGVLGNSGVDAEHVSAWRQESVEHYQSSTDNYAEALTYDPTNTWLITQFLCLESLLATRIENHSPKAPLGIGVKEWWVIVQRLVRVELERSSGGERAYALGTLAELCLLAEVYDTEGHEQAEKELRQYLGQLLALGISYPIPQIATCRQFERYHRDWIDPRWADLAAIGFEMLK